MTSFTPEVKRILTEHGCTFEREGKGDHEIWHSPITDKKFPVNSKILSRHTANGIMKQAGIRYKFSQFRPSLVTGCPRAYIAGMTDRHPANAPGNWYIDTRCTDCGAARDVAPGLIVEREGQSVFARQPQTEAERKMAWRARLLCPTASVRTVTHSDVPEDVFPEELTAGVYRLGYNAASSYGAHAFLIRGTNGNAMVDAPRFTKQVVKAIEDFGGLPDILLTHQDDVADAGRYADAFKSRVWIHQADRRAAPYATNIIDGVDPLPVTPDILAIPVPGHTKGSVAFLFDKRCLFTGDSLAWDADENDLTAHRDYCWYSWSEQTRSLARLLEYPFAWVFAGHGGHKGLSAPEMHTRLKALVARMRPAPDESPLGRKPAAR